MKKLLTLLFFSVLLTTSPLSATPLRLDYTTSSIGGGLFNYDFQLVVDNNDSSFAAGQGWGWFVFGDTTIASGSPISDFILTSIAPGPWTGLGLSSGSHNGPTFTNVYDYWIPLLGDLLTWSGTSSTELTQGNLLFSTLPTLNGGVPADFEVANHVGSFGVPDNAMTIFMLGLSISAIAAIKRRM